MAAVLLVNRQCRRKSRTFRQRMVHLDCLSDQEVVARYRLDKAAIYELESICRQDLSPLTGRSFAVSSLTKVLIGLRYLAKGDFISEVGDIHGVSKARAAVYIHQFIRSVNLRLKNIRFPTERSSLHHLKRKFYEKCRIPNVIGAVDGTLIPIQGPSQDEAAYVCRKGFHALNVQAVVDAEMRFTDVVSRWPGSQHDAAIFNACGLKTHLEQSNNGLLLGDSGYPLRRYLLTPKVNPTTPQEEAFNKHHSRGRVVVEKAFGILKSRFRCLHKSGGVLPFSPEKSSQVVVACMRLHNFCKTRGVQEPVEIITQDDDDDDNNLPNGDDRNNNNIRQELINLF
ncbi:putative nuclease HARBI1 [Ruditapes philippinarum]|uniref:putative nuclease HARBI1 n=1 Tax=Ruditapes philippinarum TaxID=129788 RepID=UPI00295B89E3|nr:putative nuclease HARBI1 [Ruditapes philippinarum]